MFSPSPGKLRPIIDDNEADVALWNKEIAKYFRGKDFMNAPWLFAEAYKYRRLHECFSVSKFWKDYDVFFRQKVSFNSIRLVSVGSLRLRYWKHSATPSLDPALLSSSFRRVSAISSSMRKVLMRRRRNLSESCSSSS